jgi:hypothetical protein
MLKRKCSKESAQKRVLKRGCSKEGAQKRVLKRGCSKEGAHVKSLTSGALFGVLRKPPIYAVSFM